ncbi:MULTISPECIES: F0F1 ATP synthase subunit B family protein [unclassified Sphingomonas]|uniref:F0F1 ATP synthase subunit B family protein n=1 Tax=unclassified Sphingomonas TaxID=196159 RepID=UPI002786AA16|nr:ATPase [Sphingomonas sp. SORGH_AS_0879]MDQ1232058.1 F-type H+-transporting ATPase subunit b [Sphingomonas sp. SORGH_AS_0879]
MPQIAQISATYASQIFWLLITFGLLYFVVGRGMVPKIQATVDAREARIAGDLAAAEAARAEADRVEAAWRAEMDAARVAAMAETNAAKARATHAFEAQVKAADADLAERLGHHDLAIANAKAEAMANLQSVAADAARDLVAKLSGVQVGEDAAADAVRKVSAHG